MDPTLNALLDELEAQGQRHDASEPVHDSRMLNLERATAQLLALWVRSARRRAVLEIGTSNRYSTLCSRGPWRPPAATSPPSIARRQNTPWQTPTCDARASATA